MEPYTADDGEAYAPYAWRYEELPSFEVTGFTKIVRSGGELYAEVRSDGRWETLRRLAGGDGWIYGVASLDRDCPKGHYRYTIGLKWSAERWSDTGLSNDTCSSHVRRSGWLIFLLEDFGAQYGQFWQDDPYQLVAKLGWVFNGRVGLHIDAYGPSYISHHDEMEFMMPVRRPGSG